MKLKLQKVNGEWTTTQKKDRFPVWIYNKFRHSKRKREALVTIENKKKTLYNEAVEIKQEITEQNNFLKLLVDEIREKEVQVKRDEEVHRTLEKKCTNLYGEAETIESRISEQKVVLKQLNEEAQGKENHVEPSPDKIGNRSFLVNSKVANKPQTCRPTTTPNRKKLRKLSKDRGENSDRLLLSAPSVSGRLRKTFEAAKSVHGDSDSAAKCGLWSTLVKFSTKEELIDTISRSRMLRKHARVTGRIEKSKKYLRCAESNIVRSVKFLYNGGLMSKRKYEAIRCLHPKGLGRHSEFLSPLKYSDLSEFIRENIVEVKTHDLPNLRGCRRDLEELLLKLADVYLKIDEEHHILNWFGQPRGSFSITLGADGAPFGKYGTETCLLLGVINVSTSLASCDHNYLLMGADAKEENEILLQVYRQISEEMAVIETKQYEIQNTAVTFVCELMPNDLKMLATLGGELNNCATYPSSFSSVRKDELCKLISKDTFLANHIVVPWDYDKRMRDVEALQSFKQKLLKSDKCSHTTTRQKITNFIAGRNSRQEFTPVVGRYIEKALLEPLHTRNNAFQQLNELILLNALDRTGANILRSAKIVSSIPADTAAARYFEALKVKVQAGKLYYRLVRWFEEKRPKGLPL
jgi:hypothetical protein